LTLANGVLYVCFAGYTDTANTDPYHGWMIGFDASNLHPLPDYVFCTTPNGTAAQFGQINGEGGIWMAGGGAAVDSDNNLFFATATAISPLSIIPRNGLRRHLLEAVNIAGPVCCGLFHSFHTGVPAGK